MNKVFSAREMPANSRRFLVGLYFIFSLAASSLAAVTYVYTGLTFDHQDPYNAALKNITIELTTPQPITANLVLPDIPQFQAQGYKLVMSDGVKTIRSSDQGFSFGANSRTLSISTVDEKGLPKTWDFQAQVVGADKIEMSSRYAPGIYANEGGDGTTFYSPLNGKCIYRAWTLGNSHVGIPSGPGSGKGTWSIKTPTAVRLQVKSPQAVPTGGIDTKVPAIPK